MIVLSDWEKTAELADWDTLVLGNGASIAVDAHFDYRSLYKIALNREMRDLKIDRLFKALGTKDFELVLDFLWRAHRVNEVLDPKHDKAEESYQALRRALISAVKSVHPKHEEGSPLLGKIADFMSQFKTIQCLNYDLIVYWAMMHENETQQDRFRDCFIYSQFEEDNDWMRRRRDGGEATLVFYPRGSLILATEFFSAERKLSVGTSSPLLDAIEKEWERESVIPLFVSEGTDSQKRRAIGRSRYLRIVSHSILPKSKNIVTYGWSMGENDAHITQRLFSSGNVNHIAVGIHRADKSQSEMNDECAAVTSTIRNTLPPNSRRPKIHFFDSSSDGCWMY